MGSPSIGGNLDGVGTNARVNNPRALTLDAVSGTLYVSSVPGRLRAVDISTAVTQTVAGNDAGLGWLDGFGTSAFLEFSDAMALDGVGGLLYLEVRADDAAGKRCLASEQFFTPPPHCSFPRPSASPLG